MRDRRGFTLIELLVVMAIIVILAALLIVRFSIAQKKGRDATRKADLKEIQNALEMYADDNKGLVPVRASDSPASGLGELTPTYISKMPEDPKYNASSPQGYWYRYASPDGKKYWLRTRLEAQKTWDVEIPPATWGNACGSYYSNCIIKSGSNIYFRIGNG